MKIRIKQNKNTFVWRYCICVLRDLQIRQAIRVVRTPGKPGSPGNLLEFHFPTWKTWKTWNFTHILLEFLASALQKLFIWNNSNKPFQSIRKVIISKFSSTMVKVKVSQISHFRTFKKLVISKFSAKIISVDLFSYLLILHLSLNSMTVSTST